MVTWQVVLQPSAIKMLSRITDKRIQNSIDKTLSGLETEPDKQGYPLTDELINYRSKRAVGQRYRIVYRCIPKSHIVSVIGIGIRKEGGKQDIYSRISKILKK